MAFPTGSTAVVYNVSQYSESGPEVNTSVTFLLSSNPQSLVDDAAQAAMDAFVAYLEQQNPLVNVSASRKYDCQLDGDAWPSA